VSSSGRPNSAYQTSGYERFFHQVDEPPSVAQIMVLALGNLDMTVHTHPEVMGLDFRTESVRPDVDGIPRVRPGFRVDDELGTVPGGADAVLFNGNNVGYWGNQFVIVDGRPVCKPRGSLFADKYAVNELAGEHHVFGWHPDRGFAVARHKFDAHEVARDTVEMSAVEPERLPWEGLSGYPILEDGQQVWHEHVRQAWDPRLLFGVGRLTGVTRTDLLLRMRHIQICADRLVRHPLTAVGVNPLGEAVVLVAELSDRSRGMTVAEAAVALQEYGVRDGVVLGAAGDAQLATTDEGFLVSPLVADYVRHAARPVSPRHRHADLAGVPVVARPVPSLVTIRDLSSLGRTAALSPSPGTGRHSRVPVPVSGV
jgi:hypothetical protein